MSLGRTSHGRASHGRALALAYPFRCLRDALRLSRSGILACPYWVGGSWSARPRAETLRPSLPREGAPPFLPYGPVALRAPRRALGVRPSATRHVVESIVTSSSRATLSRAPHDSLTCFPSVRLLTPGSGSWPQPLGCGSARRLNTFGAGRSLVCALARKGCFPKEAAGLLSERGMRAAFRKRQRCCFPKEAALQQAPRPTADPIVPPASCT